MGAQPHTQRDIREERARRTDGGESLNSESRNVHQVGNSLMIGLTDYGVRTHDVTDDDEFSVEVYPGGIWIDIGGADD